MPVQAIRLKTFFKTLLLLSIASGFIAGCNSHEIDSTVSEPNKSSRRSEYCQKKKRINFLFFSSTIWKNLEEDFEIVPEVPLTIPVAIPEELHDSLQKCIVLVRQHFRRASELSGLEVGAISRYKQRTYFLIGLYEHEQENAITDMLLSVGKKEKWRVHFYNWPGDYLHYSNFVPLEVARELTLQLIARGIENVGGREEYQKSISEIDISVLSPEDIWALQKLGFHIPEYEDVRKHSP